MMPAMETAGTTRFRERTFLMYAGFSVDSVRPVVVCCVPPLEGYTQADEKEVGLKHHRTDRDVRKSAGK